MPHSPVTRYCHALLLLPAVLTTHAAIGGELAQCRPIADDAARLACYDRLTAEPEEPTAAPSPDRRGTEPRPDTGEEAQWRQTDAAQPAEEASFGRRDPQKDAPPLEIRARIEAVAQSPLRHDILTLDNGQVWMENEPSARALKPGQDVVITEGLFSFTLKLASGRIIKVHRVD